MAVDPEPWDAVYYVDGDGLTAMAPKAGSVPLNGFVIPVATGSLDANEFEADGAGVVHIPPQEVEVTLWIQSDVPAAGNQFFDVAAWFGSTVGDSGFAFASTGP